MQTQYMVHANAIARQEGALPEWVQLAVVGTWEGHPTRREEITADSLRSLQTYLDGRFVANGTMMVVDFDHQSLTAKFRAGAAAPAAFWLDAFELRNDDTELWGRVARWTAAGKGAVLGDEYKYLSPVLTFDTADPKTGRKLPVRMVNAALTNTPFMTELEPVLNSLIETAGPGARSDAGRAQPGVAPNTEEVGMETVAILTMLVGALADSVGGVANALGVAQDADPKEVIKSLADKVAAATALAAVETRLAGVANSLGLPEDFAEDVLTAKLAELQAPKLDARVAACANALGLTPDAEAKALVDKITELSGQAADRRAEQLVANAIEGGKVTPSAREWWLKRAGEDYDGTAAIIDGMPKLLSEATSGGQAAANADTGDAAIEKEWRANSAALTGEGFTRETYRAFRLAEAGATA